MYACAHTATHTDTQRAWLIQLARMHTLLHDAHTHTHTHTHAKRLASANETVYVVESTRIVKDQRTHTFFRL